MKPTRLDSVTGGKKGTPVIFHTDAGKLTAGEMVRYADTTHTTVLLRRYRLYGMDLEKILVSPRQGITMTTSVCPVCGDEFEHPAAKRRICCSRDCATHLARDADQGNSEWQALGKRARNYNLAKIRTGSLEASV